VSGPSKRVREIVWRRSNGLCAYCGERLFRGVIYSPKSFTIDHIRPRAAGGKNRINNLAACCYECNQRRSRMFQADRRRRATGYIDRVLGFRAPTSLEER
jgi:5-methylcytosine-specific restriction endonuclease McrA